MNVCLHSVTWDLGDVEEFDRSPSWFKPTRESHADVEDGWGVLHGLNLLYSHGDVENEMQHLGCLRLNVFICRDLVMSF